MAPCALDGRVVLIRVAVPDVLPTSLSCAIHKLAVEVIIVVILHAMLMEGRAYAIRSPQHWHQTVNAERPTMPTA
jgi:hypothetical protein